MQLLFPVFLPGIQPEAFLGIGTGGGTHDPHAQLLGKGAAVRLDQLKAYGTLPLSALLGVVSLRLPDLCGCVFRILPPSFIAVSQTVNAGGVIEQICLIRGQGDHRQTAVIQTDKIGMGDHV